MASRLSSLLVRDSLVGVKQMERAFQRQVIRGGALDTILLEMGLVSEDRLLQYLSLATGLPPAYGRETGTLDPDVAEACTVEHAERFKVVPLVLDDGALRVLVHDPVDLALLEDLANDLDLAVQPLVVPEYRYHLLFAQVFGVEPEARFAKLAETLGTLAPAGADGREPPARTHGPRQPQVRPARPQPAEATAAPAESAAVEPSAKKPRKGTPTGGKPAKAKPARAQPAPAQPANGQPAEPPPAEPPPANGQPAEAGPASAEVHPGPPGDGTPAAVAPPDVSPLPLLEARRALAEVEDRDVCFTLLLRALRARVSYAALLTVQGGAAIGRVAIDRDALDRDAIAAVRIPLDGGSPFKKASASRAPHIGPIATGDPDLDGAITRLGGVMPPSGLVLPIAIRNRVVALAYAHRGAEGLAIAEVAELLPLANLAADSIERLIVKARQNPRRA